MKVRPSDRTLESFKFFPYMAWCLVLCFSLFVYKITIKLQEVSADLEMHTELSETQDQLTATKLKQRAKNPEQ